MGRLLLLLLPLLDSTLAYSPSSPNSTPRREAIQKLGSGAGALGSGLLVGGKGTSAAVPTTPIPPVQIDARGKATLPAMGLGAWAWGDALFWGYRPSEDKELEQVFRYAVEKGAGFFDTAELYGLGRSESLIKDFTATTLGSADSSSSSSIVAQTSVATKFAALPWRTKREDVVAAARASAKRLGKYCIVLLLRCSLFVDYLPIHASTHLSPPFPLLSLAKGRPADLYQIHFPNAYANEAYWDGLGDAFELGLVKSVGVSNYGSAALRACHAKLAARGIPLSSNQVQLSLLYRCPLENGLKATCDELGVQTIAYSPLGLGLLTGKYDETKYPSGPRGKLAEALFGPKGNPEAAKKLFATMREVADAHSSSGGGDSSGSRPLSQVALNWAIAKGTTVIPGARTLRQAQQNLGTLDWKLSGAEVAALDAAAAPLPPLVPPDQAPFPKVDKDTGLVMFDS